MEFGQPLSAGEFLAAGDEGERIAELQQRLQQLGYYQGAIDEQYGDVTEAAVRDFQLACGQDDDGRVESETWDLLQAAAAQETPEGEAGQRSDDGQWQWDGAQWQPVTAGGEDQATGAPTAGMLSEDGQWCWDGTQWLPAQQSDDAAHPELAFSVPDPSDWRDLARRSVPFDQWTNDQKLRAHEEYVAAGRRQANDDLSQFDEDNELFRLLAPYSANFRVFLEHVAHVNMQVSPFDSVKPGDHATLEARVHLFGTGNPAQGRILFKITTSGGLHILGSPNLVNGYASVRSTALRKGKMIFTAEYPTQNVPGFGEVVGDTAEVRYEVP